MVGCLQVQPSYHTCHAFVWPNQRILNHPGGIRTPPHLAPTSVPLVVFFSYSPTLLYPTLTLCLSNDPRTLLDPLNTLVSILFSSFGAWFPCHCDHSGHLKVTTLPLTVFQLEL